MRETRGLTMPPDQRRTDIFFVPSQIKKCEKAAFFHNKLAFLAGWQTGWPFTKLNATKLTAATSIDSIDQQIQ